MSGSCVVIAHRGIAPVTRKVASPNADPAADPGVLLVRDVAGQVDEHPEPSAVDRARAERGGRACPATHPSPSRAAPSFCRRAGSVGTGSRRTDRPMNVESASAERAFEFVPQGRKSADDGFERGPSRTSSSTTSPSGNVSRRTVASGFVQARHLDHIGDEQLVDEAVGIVDDEEPPILGDARLRSPRSRRVARGPRLMTGAMSRCVTVGMARCYRTSLASAACILGRCCSGSTISSSPARTRMRPPRSLEREVGLRAGGGGRHEALGTFNRLVWLGDTYLELIGVFDRAMAERAWVGGPAVRALDAGGGLATWAVATDDLEHRGRAPERGRRRSVGAHPWRAPAPRRSGGPMAAVEAARARPGTAAVPHRARRGRRRVVACRSSRTRRGRSTRSAGPSA